MLFRSGIAVPDWYPDGDGDTYGDPAGTTVCAATAPTGRVADHTDCCDAVADANPGQTAWFDVSYTCGTSAASFDYDCDGVAEQRDATAGGGCARVGGRCATTVGWADATVVPACGESASFVTGCTGGCRPILETRTQACR